MKRSNSPHSPAFSPRAGGVLLIALFAVAGLQAGSPESPESPKEPLVLNDAAPALVTPTVESRLRYEYGDQDGLEPSHAGTWRNRLGLLTAERAGFQLFAEYEGTLTVDRDSYRAAAVHGPPSRTVIADPESHELNQLWGSYEGPGGMLSVKAGRQHLVLDNQRFIGAVGWRQNEQTFDVAKVSLEPTEDLRLFYGYLWRVNRIFGSQVETPALTDFEGDSHLLNARYTGLPFGTLTAYGYWLDLTNGAGSANSNRTVGLNLAGEVFDTGLAYYLEYAHQADAFDSGLDYGAHYAHGALEAPLMEGVTATVGLEALGADDGVGFRTPLATLHKFNGFADRFLATPGAGLTDVYGKVAFPLPFGFSGSIAYHQFRDDEFGGSFGDEVDVVVKKPLREGVLLLAKGAFFRGRNGQPDLSRVILEVNWIVGP